MRKLVEVDKDRNVDHKNVHWSEKQKYKAVALYKMTGNMAAVSRTLGIPSNTLFLWRKSKWWSQFEDDLLQEKRALTSASLQKLAKKAAEITADRLENGDWVFQNGELIRKPVNALAANKILQESLDREVRLEEHYSKQKQVDNDLQIQERLKLIFDEMARFANSKEIRSAEGGDPDLVVDATVVEEVADAVHDEREAGLQEGAGLGEEDDGERTPRRPSSPEPSPS